jgi:hypothetical protein
MIDWGKKIYFKNFVKSSLNETGQAAGSIEDFFHNIMYV